MYLVTAATSFELEGFLVHFNESEKNNLLTLITGVGPVETAVRSARFLSTIYRDIDGVFNIGIGGAFVQVPLPMGMLDICIAKKEVLGDLGVCYPEKIEQLGPFSFEIKDEFELESDLFLKACAVMDKKQLPYKQGTFVTVNCVSATEKRGNMLALLHNAICENMEGAALARVCYEFSLPMVELRCVSNMVEDRKQENWKIKEAVSRCGEIAAVVVKGMKND